MSADNRLLFTISAKGRVSWSSFKIYYHSLSENTFANRSTFLDLFWLTVRTLDSLAFCDFDFTGNNVYACSPSLVALPNATHCKAILVGARSPLLVEQILGNETTIPREVDVTQLGQPSIYQHIPSRVMFESDSWKRMKELAIMLKLGLHEEPVSWQILNFVNPIHNYLADCSWSEAGDSDTTRSDFNPLTLQFQRSKGPNKSAVRLSSYVTSNNQTRHFLWRGSQRSAVDKDWGRYAVLSDLRIPALAYDETSEQLLVPVTAPLPRPYARALALCSGIAPSLIPRAKLNAHLPHTGDCLAYSSVPKYFAGLLAKKLNQYLAIIHQEEPCKIR